MLMNSYIPDSKSWRSKLHRLWIIGHWAPISTTLQHLKFFLPSKFRLWASWAQLCAVIFDSLLMWNTLGVRLAEAQRKSARWDLISQCPKLDLICLDVTTLAIVSLSMRKVTCSSWIWFAISHVKCIAFASACKGVDAKLLLVDICTSAFCPSLVKCPCYATEPHESRAKSGLSLIGYIKYPIKIF